MRVGESMGNEAVLEKKDYCLLEDLRLEIDGEQGSFSFCFWLYLPNSTTFPATIIHQVSNYSFSFFIYLLTFHLLWYFFLYFFLVWYAGKPR